MFIQIFNRSYKFSGKSYFVQWSAQGFFKIRRVWILILLHSIDFWIYSSRIIWQGNLSLLLCEKVCLLVIKILFLSPEPPGLSNTFKELAATFGNLAGFHDDFFGVWTSSFSHLCNPEPPSLPQDPDEVIVDTLTNFGTIR